MKQNKGFSLIELVVVIAIMVVLTGVGILQMQMVTGYYAKQCAEEIEAQLNKVQVTNMARKATLLEIYRSATDEGYYARITENKGLPALEKTTERKIGRSRLEITYIMNPSDTNVKTLDSTTPIKLIFDRATGELKMVDGTENIGCYRMWIQQKGTNQKVYTITIHQVTGKVEVDSDAVGKPGESMDSTEAIPAPESPTPEAPIPE